MNRLGGKRPPRILDHFVNVRLVLCCRLNPNKLIFDGVRGNTCRSIRVVCGNAHPVLDSLDLDLVEDTLVARF